MQGRTRRDNTYRGKVYVIEVTRCQLILDLRMTSIVYSAQALFNVSSWVREVGSPTDYAITMSLSVRPVRALFCTGVCSTFCIESSREVTVT